MYKIFHGFHLVEAYQDLKKAKRLAKNQTVARCIKLTVAITLSLILWLLPIDTFGIEGLTVIEQRLISIFIFATLMWVFEHVHFETRINGQHFNPNLIFDLKERTLRKECIKCTKNGSKIVVKTQIPDNRIAQNKK